MPADQAHRAPCRSSAAPSAAPAAGRWRRCPACSRSANMFCGFVAILVSIRGEYRLAAVLIGLSIVFDITDGAVARLVGAVTPFGLQFDSLADLVSFGLAPALLAFTLFSQGRDEWDPLGWIACFLWVACAAIRLARFNTTVDPTADKRYFTGLPSPGAAGRRPGVGVRLRRPDAGPRPAVGAAGRRRPGAAHGQQRPVPLVPVAGQPEERPPVRADRTRGRPGGRLRARPGDHRGRARLRLPAGPAAAARSSRRWPGCCRPGSRRPCRDGAARSGPTTSRPSWRWSASWPTTRRRCTRCG